MPSETQLAPFHRLAIQRSREPEKLTLYEIRPPKSFQKLRFRAELSSASLVQVVPFQSQVALDPTNLPEDAPPPKGSPQAVINIVASMPTTKLTFTMPPVWPTAHPLSVSFASRFSYQMFTNL